MAAAKELGVITYVTDFLPLEEAPAKQIADHYFMVDAFDIDGIVELCKQEGIDGVLSTSLDACQRPYFYVCEKLGVPCFGTEEQFRILTDKTAFKKCCRENGVDVIDEYTVEDFATEEICAERVSFPVIMKPCDSRGSRGQSICNTYHEAQEGIRFALSESKDGKIVIEKYMGQANDFSMTILVVDGYPYPFRTVDRFLGTYEDGLDKLAVGSATPSVFTDFYMKNAHEKICKFVKAVGLKTAPMFMQGFVDGDTIRFYDPGLRLPGSDFERVYEYEFGRNILYPLIEYALTGRASREDYSFSEQDVYLNGKSCSQILLALRPGTISEISGMDEVKAHPNVISVSERFCVGDTVKETHNVGQRFCEIDILCDTNEQMAEVVSWVYDTLKIYDENHEEMATSKYNPKRFIDRSAK